MDSRDLFFVENNNNLNSLDFKFDRISNHYSLNHDQHDIESFSDELDD